MKRSPFLLFLLAACQTPTETRLVLGFDQDSPWAYFREKYDADGSGSISPSEYDAEREAFARLDRSGDGELTAIDFVPARGDLRFKQVEGRAKRALFEHFQDPTERSRARFLLHGDELVSAIAKYDADGDGRIQETEFRELAAACFHPLPQDDLSRLLGQYDPWKALLTRVDSDADLALSTNELLRYFATLSRGEEKLFFPLLGGPSGLDPASRIEPESGPRVGTLAPDFELSSPSGETTIRLSDFVGERPVALIFGSYT